MGVVVAATHVHLDQRVALKFVQPAVSSNPHATERFLREARAAVRLKSQHVARVLDVGTLDNGTPYIVMEFLEGSDHGRVLANRGSLPVESAVDYVLQACEAVAEAHSLGIVHRDLKPQNLFLTQHIGGAPMIKVLDFGISKLTVPLGSSRSSRHALTQTASVMGSPLYMAPEQMRSSRTADPRADIWALGVVLYELLTGGVPFDADSMPELCLKVVEETARPIEELRPDVPPALRAVIARCLEKDPARRFSDAAALATALEPFANAASRPAADRARRVAVGGPNALEHSDGLGSASGLTTPPPDRRATAAAWGESVAPPPPSRRVLGAVLASLGILAMLAVLVLGALRVRQATRAAASPAASVTITSASPSPAPTAQPFASRASTSRACSPSARSTTGRRTS
jgi:serine/threonine-protein kinase